MANVTTQPGLLSIDPIQGLEDYVNEFKPYHTKVFDVLFEYVYTDDVNTTVTETAIAESLDIVMTKNGSTIGWNAEPAAMFAAIVSVGTNTIIVANNYTNSLKTGDIVNITGSSNSAANTNYVIQTSTYNSTTNQTTITVTSQIPSFSGSGTATFFPRNTPFPFSYNITGFIPSYTVYDPGTAQSLTAPALQLQGNTLLGLQPESIFAVQGTSLNNGTFYVVFIQYIMGFNSDGSRNINNDVTIVGFGQPSGSPQNAPFNTILQTPDSGGIVVPYGS